MNFKILMVITSLSFATAQAGVFQYGGYMRAPVTTNSMGGRGITLNNPGSLGNEFRLGNEGGYGEVALVQHFAETKDLTAPYFDANLTFAYSPSMNTQYADTTPTGDNIQFVEMYVKGGNLDGIPMSYWAGKRFYRDGDIHMNDFFYFADMSGNGGGIENLQIANGSLSLAALQYVDDRKVTNSNTGFPAKRALDFRWRDFAINDANKLELWVAQGYTAPGTGTVPVGGAPVNYQASSGTAVGVKWTSTLAKGTNNVAVVYGSGVMQSLTLNDTAFATDDSIKKRNRIRFVESYYTELGDKWAVQAAAIYDQAQSGATPDIKTTWSNIGLRPMYFVTDNFRVQAEVGHSMIKNDSEVNGLGGQAGNRTLTRVTLAPEVSFARGFYARPVVRFYVTHTMWNDANKDLGNAGSLLTRLNTNGIAALNDKNGETQTGFQAEVWF